MCSFKAISLILLLCLPCLALHIIPVHNGRSVVLSHYSNSRHVVDVGPLAATISDQDMDDAKLLKTTKKQQLVELCQQMNLATTGTKEELLSRLRAHAAAQVQAERARRVARVKQVEEGSDDPKVRHEIVSSPFVDEEDEEYDEDDDFVFYHAPEVVKPSSLSSSNTTTTMSATTKKKPTHISQASITAPPPPVEPNEKGERVVKIYSTTDENDLTGIAASQPGQTAMSSDALTNAVPASSSSLSSQPWDPQNNQRATSTKEQEKAKEEIIELVQTLLSMTGLPAFTFDSDDDDDDDDDDHNFHSSVPGKAPYKGFDPAQVSTQLLASSSRALRTGRGEILQDVLRQFELQAVGQDGMRGDDVSKGGGHYREVAKVRAFLEGYRRAEVRRIARETTAMLLDKLILEGVEGLDMTLATMTRSSDDNSNYGGELNDSLLEFLNDVIRQQEKKVDKLLAKRRKASEKKLPGTTVVNDDLQEDPIDSLWNVTMTDDGERIESLDPNDPKVKAALAEELTKEEIAETLAMERGQRTPTPETAPEQLLLLLTLLRERIKTEAVFVPDEKGRNLRLLAYCLQLSSNLERKQLLLKELGNSLVRVDSFIELVSSSVEYGESASYQLQPARTKKPLNVKELKRILSLAQEFRKEQERKAAGQGLK